MVSSAMSFPIAGTTSDRRAHGGAHEASLAPGRAVDARRDRAGPGGLLFCRTPHKDGFDSRYADIGFVCARQIIGTGEPLL
jgi:type IV secretory pathway protease TraF